MKILTGVLKDPVLHMLLFSALVAGLYHLMGGNDGQEEVQRRLDAGIAAANARADARHGYDTRGGAKPPGAKIPLWPDPGVHLGELDEQRRPSQRDVLPIVQVRR